jgi:hypothetical protein
MPGPSDLRKLVAAATALAAALLLTNIGLALLVARRSRQICEGLERLRGTTADLRLVPELNTSLERMTRNLQAIRRGRVD